MPEKIIIKICPTCGFKGVGRKYANHFMTNNHKQAKFKTYLF
jgi:hypothetical protein